MRAGVAWALVMLLGCSDLDAQLDPSPSWAYRIGDVAGPDGAPPRICSSSDDCRAVEISCGQRTACAKLESGQVACWGANLRSGRPGFPESAPEGSRMRAIEVDEYLCGADDRGGVTCSGRGVEALIGLESGRSGALAFELPSPPRQVSTSGLRSCATLEDGSIHCWGQHLGDIERRNLITLSPRPVPGLGPAVSVEIAQLSAMACALLADGTTACWFFDDSGEDRQRWGTAVAVAGLTDATSFTMGNDGAGPICALVEDRTVVCQQVERDPDGTILRDRFVPIPGISDAIQLTSPIDAIPSTRWLPDDVLSEAPGCAVLESGVVRCWGRVALVGLTPGEGPTIDLPVEAAAEVCLGPSWSGPAFGCVRLRTGRVRCWGDVYGNGMTSSVPIAIEGLE